MLGASLGLVVLWSFLLLSVHVLLRLHAATVVSSAALDGARHVASAGVDHDDPVATAAARAEAEHDVRSLLGRVGQDAHLDWSGSTADHVSLRVVVDVPDVLPDGLAATLPFDVVDRTAVVRIESLR